MSIGKVRPYEHLSDGELAGLVDEAVDIRLRMAMLHPDQVEATLIAHGCPQVAAHRQVRDLLLRGFAARFHLDAQDAAIGDEQARTRIEHIEAGWERLRARGAPVTL